MKLTIGEKIKELRLRDGRRQEDLALALGVTNQAVSRWEKDGSYPDMEMIPAIANYFGVTIDQLFGYENAREKKVAAILAQVASYDIKHSGDDVWVEECLALLRDGLAEFPGNEVLTLALADTLWEAGWRRHHGWLSYDEEGFIRHHYDTHKKNPFWAECIKVCEHLVETTKKPSSTPSGCLPFSNPVSFCSPRPPTASRTQNTLVSSCWNAHGSSPSS